MKTRILCFHFFLILIPFGLFGQATLPVSTTTMDKANLPTGFSHSGLGSNYSGPKLKFDTQGDYLDLFFNAAPGDLTFDMGTNNSFSGTIPTTATFSVLESADGVSFSTVADYSNVALGTKTISTLNSATRYIRWIYTVKPSGTNVALYNIDLVAGSISTTPTVNLSVSTSSASEAATTAVTVTATASAAVSGAQTVDLVISGSGITAGDYTLSNSTITIANGNTSGSLTFTVIDDAAIEGSETATLTINNPSAGIDLGSTLTQDVTITDNDNCASSTTTLPYNGISGDAEFEHTSSNPPAAGPQEACGSNFRLSYSTAPATDVSSNFFGTLSDPSNGLASIDWGGEATFQTFIIDVSGVSSVDIETFGSTQGSGFNGGGEYLQWWYTLDGGSQVNIGSAFTGSGSLANTVNGLNVSGINQLVVGFTFNMNGGSDGLQDMDVTVVQTPVTPTLNTSVASLTGFYTTAGTASASQNYTLTGSNLSPASGNITVTAPTGFQVSTNNSTFSGSVSVPYTGGAVSQTIYVRIASTASAGTPSGNVTNAGGGATTQNVAVDGTVCSASGSFSVGDISIVGFSSDDPDAFSFVNWVNIPNGNTLNFTDNAWTGSALTTNEGTISWQNNTGAAITPGTVITYVAGTGFDLGTQSGSSGSFALSTSQDNLFIYEGTASCPLFVYGFANDAWINSGSTTTSSSYLPSSLNVANGNLSTPTTEDNWEFSDPRNDQASIAAYKPLVNNLSNWTPNNSLITLSSTDFTVASSTPSVELSASAGSGSEAAASVITITATASAAVTGNQTVTLSVSGAGITAGDYTLSNAGVITILNGQATGSVTFTIVDDAVVEGSETATLSYSGGLSSGLIAGTSTSVNIGINDNDGTTLYSQASGGTNDPIWDIIPNGTGQLATAFGGFSEFMDVVIQVGHTVDLTVSGHDMKSLTVNPGGKIYANYAVSPEYIDIFGNVVNNGIIGNGSTLDLISFNWKGTNPIVFSGTGTYNLGRMRKESGASGSITIDANMNLGFAGAVLYNENGNSTFDLTIAAGRTVSVTDPLGDVSIDGIDGTASSERGGSIVVNGTLTVADKIFALATNSASFPCSFTVGSTGKIITKDIDVAINSGFTGITFNAGGTLEVNGTMAVTGGTFNAAGAVILNNGATLLHGSGTTGGGGNVTGNVIVKRQGSNASNVNNFWSTPVAGGNIPGTNGYSFDPTMGNQDPSDDQDPDPGWIPFSGAMSAGTGYTSRSGGLASFIGNPNTGNVNVPLTYYAYSPGNASPGTPFNLVGNPYPGAISANSLISANADIFGSIYYWDDDLSGGTGYSVSDFAVWNGAGSVGGGGHTPNGNIASCQGFMVRALSGTSVLNFTNSMRVNGNNSQFFRVDGEPSRMWLSLTGNDLYNEILVAMIDDATDEEDRLYDAVKLRGNTDISLSTVNNGWDYAIMAFAPVVNEKVVPLNVFVSQQGSYTFHSHTMENFDGYTVHLEDRRTSQWYPMVQGSEVNINLAQGDHSDRFYLHFNQVEQPAGVGSSNPFDMTIHFDNDQLTLLADRSLSNVTFEVMAMDGRLVQLTSNRSVKKGIPTLISLGGIASGTYILRLSSKNEVLTQRFVKP
jgi:hypothetical protein